MELLEQGMNRVTDTCIPEDEAIRRLEKAVLKVWQKAEKEGKRYFPYEYAYQLISSGMLKEYYEIDPKDSWIVAAQEKNLPIFTPGWEDSTLANIFVSHVISGDLKSHSLVKSGSEQMEALVNWYKKETKNSKIGFFQIGGGIAGDFPICVVPLIRQDLLEKSTPLWGYFCQISDSITSFGSYSGATAQRKNQLGQTGYQHAKIRHRVRRINCCSINFPICYRE